MLLVVDRSHPVLIHIFQCPYSTFAGWATGRSAILSFRQLFALGLWLGTGRPGKSPSPVSILLISVPLSLGRDILDITLLPLVRKEIRKREKEGEMRKMKESFSCPEGRVCSAAPCSWNETWICALCTECRPSLPVPKQQQTSLLLICACWWAFFNVWASWAVGEHFLCSSFYKRQSHSLTSLQS